MIHRLLRSAVILTLTCTLTTLATSLPSSATSHSPHSGALPTLQEVVCLTGPHLIYSSATSSLRTTKSVPEFTPITHAHTCLPVLGSYTSQRGTTRLHVALPGRPNGHSGWIANTKTLLSTDPWKIMVSVSGGTLKVYKNAQLQRTLPAIVGGAGTPTPLGVFFVEEVVPLYANAPGEPYALALSARSGVLRSFDGGPGQIAIHSTAYLHSTGESHGCLRVSLANDLWLDRHVPAGTVVAISG